MALWSVFFLGLAMLLNGINGMFHDEVYPPYDNDVRPPSFFEYLRTFLVSVNENTMSSSVGMFSRRIKVKFSTVSVGYYMSMFLS